MFCDKDFWKQFFCFFFYCLLFFFLGSGALWLVTGFIHIMIINFAWIKILLYGISILLLAVISFFMARSNYREIKRTYFQSKIINLRHYQQRETFRSQDENSSEEDRYFASANAEMYLKEIKKAEKEFEKYGGKLW